VDRNVKSIDDDFAILQRVTFADTSTCTKKTGDVSGHCPATNG